MGKEIEKVKEEIVSIRGRERSTCDQAVAAGVSLSATSLKPLQSTEAVAAFSSCLVVSAAAGDCM